MGPDCLVLPGVTEHDPQSRAQCRGCGGGRGTLIDGMKFTAQPTGVWPRTEDAAMHCAPLTSPPKLWLPGIWVRQPVWGTAPSAPQTRQKG